MPTFTLPHKVFWLLSPDTCVRFRRRTSHWGRFRVEASLWKSLPAELVFSVDSCCSLAYRIHNKDKLWDVSGKQSSSQLSPHSVCRRRAAVDEALVHSAGRRINLRRAEVDSDQTWWNLEQASGWKWPCWSERLRLRGSSSHQPSMHRDQANLVSWGFISELRGERRLHSLVLESCPQRCRRAAETLVLESSGLLCAAL